MVGLGVVGLGVVSVTCCVMRAVVDSMGVDLSFSVTVMDHQGRTCYGGYAVWCCETGADSGSCEDGSGDAAQLEVDHSRGCDGWWRFCVGGAENVDAESRN